MVELNYQRGAIYILENSKAQRVKVGMTTNDVVDRLRSVNDMWLGQKVTCQICGARVFINDRGFAPKHVKDGRNCKGGDALPLEKDVALAESHLENLKKSLGELSGSEKGSVTRKVRNLEGRIDLYRNRDKPVGRWQIGTVYHTEKIEQVELLSHKILADRLDRKALFGEVFSCSLQEATEAVEAALSQLDLLDSARKETQLQSERGVYLKYLEYQETERKPANYECVMCEIQWEGVEPGVNSCPKCETHLYRRFLAYV